MTRQTPPFRRRAELAIAIERSWGTVAEMPPAISRQLRANIERVSSLGRDVVDAMFHLYRTYYDATSRALFESDLGDKDFAVVLRDEDDAIAGFFTLALLDIATDSDRLHAIYSDHHPRSCRRNRYVTPMPWWSATRKARMGKGRRRCRGRPPAAALPLDRGGRRRPDLRRRDRHQTAQFRRNGHAPAQAFSVHRNHAGQLQ
jgi:hypothetical protein